MRTGIKFEVSPPDRFALEKVMRDRNSPQKHVWRAWIILLSGDGLGTTSIMLRTGKSKPCVWRWQERFMAEGVEGLLRDKTRPSRIAPLAPDVIARVVALTLSDVPGETTHWTADLLVAAMAAEARPIRAGFDLIESILLAQTGLFRQEKGARCRSCIDVKPFDTADDRFRLTLRANENFRHYRRISP